MGISNHQWVMNAFRERGFDVEFVPLCPKKHLGIPHTRGRCYYMGLNTKKMKRMLLQGKRPVPPDFDRFVAQILQKMKDMAMRVVYCAHCGAMMQFRAPPGSARAWTRCACGAEINMPVDWGTDEGGASASASSSAGPDSKPVMLLPRNMNVRRNANTTFV